MGLTCCSRLLGAAVHDWSSQDRNVDVFVAGDDGIAGLRFLCRRGCWYIFRRICLSQGCLAGTESHPNSI